MTYFTLRPYLIRVISATVMTYRPCVTYLTVNTIMTSLIFNFKNSETNPDVNTQL